MRYKNQESKESGILRMKILPYLFLQLGVLHPEFLLVEVGILRDGRAAAGGADDVAESLSHSDIFAADSVVVGS